MHFDLVRPCANCPFRNDIEAYLLPLRAEDICDSLTRKDQTFACHKTVDYSGDGDGVVTESSQHCAGALILLEKLNKPNQMMRIAERLQVYDRRKLDMKSPVFDSTEEFIEACEHAQGGGNGPRLAEGDRIQDNDMRGGAHRVLVIDRLEGRYAYCSNPQQPSLKPTRIQRNRIHTDKRPRKSGFSLLRSPVEEANQHEITGQRIENVAVVES